MKKEPRFSRYIQLKTKEQCIAWEYSLISTKLSCMKVQLHTGVEVDAKCSIGINRREMVYLFEMTKQPRFSRYIHLKTKEQCIV